MTIIDMLGFALAAGLSEELSSRYSAKSDDP
jgi:hypothetical protein